MAKAILGYLATGRDPRTEQELMRLRRRVVELQDLVSALQRERDALLDRGTLDLSATADTDADAGSAAEPRERVLQGV